MATIDVKDAAGSTVAIEKPLIPGRTAAATSRPVALSSEDFAVLDGLEAAIAATNTAIASTNTKIDTVITAVQLIDNSIAGSETQVDVITMPTTAVTGPLTDAQLRAAVVPVSGTVTANIGTVATLATAAKQPALGTAGSASTDVITVQGIASGTAQPISGTVTVNALPAGTNNIGDVDVLTLPVLPAGTNNIGDIDVLTVPADPFGANADAASATGSHSAKLRGIATALGVTALDLGSGTGGTRTIRTIIDTSQVPVVGQTTMTASSPVTMASDQPAISVNEQDGAAVSGSVTSAATLFTQDMTGYSSISVQVTSAGSSCTISYETSDDNTNWVGTTGIPSTFTGSAAGLIIVQTSAVGLWQFPKRGRYFRARVSTYGSGTVTVAGSLSKVLVFPSLQAHVGGILGADIVKATGQVAHNATGAVNPILAAVRGFSALPAALTTSGNTCNWIGTMVGAGIVKPYSIPESDWTFAGATGGITDTTAVTIQAAGAAGLRNYVTAIQFFNSAATASEISIRDGAAGTVIWRGMVPASMTHPAAITFPTPLKSTAATLLEVVMGTTATATRVSAQGYVAP